MKRISVLITVVMVICLCLFVPVSYGTEKEQATPDAIEQVTGLKKVTGERFIIDLKYNSEDNFLHKNVYLEFGINSCYVRPEVYEKLQAMIPVLEKMKLKIVFFDCYRPLEVQEAMWKILPDARYVANPKTGSLHNRAIALDVGLADEENKYMDFPTPFDSFEKTASQSYKCPEADAVKCQNRETLKKLMEEAGFKSISTEWWHYQLENPKQYPLISLKKMEGVK